MRRVRLLVAADAATRLGIRMALGREADICAEVDTHAQAIRAAKSHQPDVCLISRAHCGEGMATVWGICRAAPDIAVVVLTEETNDEDLLDAVRAGAIGYVPGALDAEGVRRIVRVVVSNEAVVPRTLVRGLLTELRGDGVRGDGLTAREAQVLGMLRRGHTTAAIAERLAIAPVTVRRHVSGLVRKLGLEDRSQLLDGGAWSQARKAREHQTSTA